MRPPVIGDMVRTVSDLLITKWDPTARDHDALLLRPGAVGLVARCIGVDSIGPHYEIDFEVRPGEIWPRSWFPDSDVFIEVMDPVTAIGTLDPKS